MVVCHNCPNTVHVLCCLNLLKEQSSDFAVWEKFLPISCGIRCYKKIMSDKASSNTSVSAARKGSDDAGRTYTSWLNDNASSKPEKNL
jgi:hypothetical protein